eukprot:1615303-Rhodomonas_salina.2
MPGACTATKREVNDGNAASGCACERVQASACERKVQGTKREVAHLFDLVGSDEPELLVRSRGGVGRDAGDEEAKEQRESHLAVAKERRSTQVERASV